MNFSSYIFKILLLVITIAFNHFRIEMAYAQQTYTIASYTSSILAQELPVPQRHVEDGANIINESVEYALNGILQALEKKTGAQMIVLTINTTDNIPIETFSLKLAKKWKLGQKGRNNGVLIVIAKNDRVYRIEVGLGLERILSNNFCKTIGDTYFTPYFSKGQFGEGINEGVVAIAQKILEENSTAISDNTKISKQIQPRTIPTIEKIYEEHGIQKKVDIKLPSGYENVMPESRGKVYFVDEGDNEESIIASIEVVSIRKGGIAHAKITGQSSSIRIKKGYFVKFLPLPQVADTIAPTGSININNNSAYTNSCTVTIRLFATDNVGVIGYYISPNLVMPSADASGWQFVSSSKSYSGNISYTLDSKDGRKAIHVWYKDASGNISTVASGYIILDTTTPTPGIASSVPTKESSVSGSDKCTTCNKKIGEGHICGVTIFCQQCKEEVGPGHICDLTFFCHDCKKEVGDGHICGITTFCFKCEEEVGSSHLCDITYFCYDCEREVGDDHICGETYFCFTCKKELPKNHDHSKTENKPIIQPYKSSKVLATVNGENVTQEDVDKILNRFSQIDKEQLSTVIKQILDGLITQKLIMQFIKDSKIEVSQAEINTELNKVRNDVKSNPSLTGQTLEQVLESHGSSIEALGSDIVISLSLEKYLGKDIDGMQQNVKHNMMEEKAQLLIKQLREKAKIKYFTK